MASTEQDLFLFMQNDSSDVWWEGALYAAAGGIEQPASYAMGDVEARVGLAPQNLEVVVPVTPPQLVSTHLPVAIVTNQKQQQQQQPGFTVDADHHVTSIYCGFESCRSKPFVLKVKANDKTAKAKATVSMAVHMRKKHNSSAQLGLFPTQCQEAVMSTTSSGNDVAAFDRVVNGLGRDEKK